MLKSVSPSEMRPPGTRAGCWETMRPVISGRMVTLRAGMTLPYAETEMGWFFVSGEMVWTIFAARGFSSVSWTGAVRRSHQEMPAATMRMMAAMTRPRGFRFMAGDLGMGPPRARWRPTRRVRASRRRARVESSRVWTAVRASMTGR